jgi:succinyl-diaminopimelate desuccinylase
MAGLAERLAQRTLELVDIPSESRDEAAIREHLLALVPSGLHPDYAGDEAYLVVPNRRSDVPLVVLAGHYDTVPAQGNFPGRIAEGAVHGLGASDMKAGVAVALELVRDLASEAPGRCDVGLLLFGREELPPSENPLPALLDASRTVRETALAILLEPTDGEIHAGCLGHLTARLTFLGVSGHSARPWDADNAIERAVAGLAPALSGEPRQALVGGLVFREVLVVTRFEAGIADNVVPDRATATISFRYAPDRAPEDAPTYVEKLFADVAEVEVTGNSPPGAVTSGNALVQALLESGARGLAPKQAWTNVADFTARGIDAVNFGPGHTAQAHRREEHVEIAALVHAYETLRRFLASPIREDGL